MNSLLRDSHAERSTLAPANETVKDLPRCYFGITWRFLYCGEAHNSSSTDKRLGSARPTKVDISAAVGTESRALRHNPSETKLQHMRHS